ncbi:hypothetical protein B4U79_17639 [Dinothrombium tinctorium]|uniref:RING-type domain-containing protein n=1 Tax=Dinothrombium tinctorium TaxID=1965070 RepID=A0A443R4I6_9ACAR|nr:hypothetical protein B4U79_17639 [Dinothrombium tinctorium]
MGFELNRFVSHVDESVKCPICSKVFENPVQLDCVGNEFNQHIFCRSCIIERFASSDSLRCPIDGKQFKRNTRRSLFQTPPQHVFDALSLLQIKCAFAASGCPLILKLSELDSHVDLCEFNPYRRIMSSTSDFPDTGFYSPPYNDTPQPQPTPPQQPQPQTQFQTWFNEFDSWSMQESLQQQQQQQQQSSQATKSLMDIERRVENKLRLIEEKYRQKIEEIKALYEAKLEESNQEQLQRIEAGYQKDIENLRESNQSHLSRLEEKFRREIESLRRHWAEKETHKPLKKQKFRHVMEGEEEETNALNEKDRLSEEVALSLQGEIKRIRKEMHDLWSRNFDEYKKCQENEFKKMKDEVHNFVEELKRNQCEMKKCLGKEINAVKKSIKEKDARYNEVLDMHLDQIDSLVEKFDQCKEQIKSSCKQDIKKLENNVKKHELKIKKFAQEIKGRDKETKESEAEAAACDAQQTQQSQQESTEEEPKIVKNLRGTKRKRETNVESKSVERKPIVKRRRPGRPRKNKQKYQNMHKKQQQKTRQQPQQEENQQEQPDKGKISDESQKEKNDAENGTKEVEKKKESEQQQETKKHEEKQEASDRAVVEEDVRTQEYCVREDELQAKQNEVSNEKQLSEEAKREEEERIRREEEERERKRVEEQQRQQQQAEQNTTDLLAKIVNEVILEDSLLNSDLWDANVIKKTNPLPAAPKTVSLYYNFKTDATRQTFQIPRTASRSFDPRLISEIRPTTAPFIKPIFEGKLINEQMSSSSSSSQLSQISAVTMPIMTTTPTTPTTIPILQENSCGTENHHNKPVISEPCTPIINTSSAAVVNGEQHFQAEENKRENESTEKTVENKAEQNRNEAEEKKEESKGKAEKTEVAEEVAEKKEEVEELNKNEVKKEPAPAKKEKVARRRGRGRPKKCAVSKVKKVRAAKVVVEEENKKNFVIEAKEKRGRGRPKKEENKKIPSLKIRIKEDEINEENETSKEKPKKVLKKKSNEYVKRKRTKKRKKIGRQPKNGRKVSTKTTTKEDEELNVAQILAQETVAAAADEQQDNGFFDNIPSIGDTGANDLNDINASITANTATNEIIGQSSSSSFFDTIDKVIDMSLGINPEKPVVDDLTKDVRAEIREKDEQMLMQIS